MSLSPAPYFHDVAYGPVGGAAFWAHTSDNLRLRVGHWPLKAAKGTVLILPGRTEFIEKYGQIAKELATRGLASVCLDWRGQGLSDRLLDMPLVGHVRRFSDYQLDVASLMQMTDELDMPRPFFLLAHSMGGAIGLRSMLKGLAVKAAVFSAPMWGIKIAPHLKPAAWILSHTLPQVGRGHQLPPGAQLEHHVLADGFENNLLTRDRAQFDIMYEQLSKHPELALGGPSYVWLREALQETRYLAAQPCPNQPCIAYLGTNEQIVEIRAIQKRMKRWTNGQLELVLDGEHEVLMESSAVTQPMFDDMAELFLRYKNT